MKKFYTLFLFLYSLCLVGQDMQYSQYYACPLYLNPAFAGSSLAPRISTNYHNQWSKFSNQPEGATVAFDLFFDNINSGVGIIANLHSASNILKNNEIGLLYSYNLKIGEEQYLRFGLQSSFVNRKVDFTGLIFPDQIDDNTPTNEKQKYPPINYLDFSSGVLYYTPKYWFGAAFHHLNRPNQSIFKSNLEESRLPMKISLHGGYNIIFDEFIRSGEMPKSVLTPSFNYKRQGKFEQLDLGAYYTFLPLSIGIWYRGIPFKKDPSNHIKNESLVFSLAYRQENLSIGYSYDLSISKIRPSGGSHEISVVYKFEPIETRRNRRRWNVAVPVPEF